MPVAATPTATWTTTPAPAGPPSAPPVFRVAAPEDRLDGPVDHVLPLVIGAIALGGLYQLFFRNLERNHTIGNQAMGRYILVGTVAFYAIVGLTLIWRLRSAKRPMHWTVGAPLPGALLGVGVGGVLGLIGVLANSMLAHHLSTDPNATFLSSEGDVPHVVTTLLLLSIAAPLVEETLFRGIWMESLRPKGAVAAFFGTAIAFAVWHWNFPELRYYAAMGVILGALYWKRGLVASMCAHATFNGVLAVVAIMLAVTPASVVHVGNVTFEKPQGWHLVHSARMFGGTEEEFQGPSDAAIDVATIPEAVGSAQQLLARLQSDVDDDLLPGVVADVAQARIVAEPVGDVVQVPISERASSGEIDFVPTTSSLATITALTAGSAKAERDVAELLNSVQVDAAGASLVG